VLALGIAGVSTGSILARVAVAEAHPFVISAYRLGLVTLALLPFVLRRGRAELQELSWRQVVQAVLSGILLAGHFATWIASLDHTAIANSVLLVSTSPLWVALLGPLVCRDRVGWRVFLCIAVALAGSAVIAAGDVGQGSSAVRGDVLALAGGVCAAFYLLIGRNLRRRLSLPTYAVLCYGSATVALLALAVLLRLPLVGFGGKTYAALVAMAVLSQGLGHTSFNWALKWLRPHVVAAAFLGEPIGAAILAYLVFGEGLTLTTGVGGSLVLFSLYLLVAGERGSNRSTEQCSTEQVPGVRGDQRPNGMRSDET
jgi:drug/metabolite transporter (DMT)-like permease